MHFAIRETWIQNLNVGHQLLKNISIENYGLGVGENRNSAAFDQQSQLNRKLGFRFAETNLNAI